MSPRAVRAALSFGREDRREPASVACVEAGRGCARGRLTSAAAVGNGDACLEATLLGLMMSAMNSAVALAIEEHESPCRDLNESPSFVSVQMRTYQRSPSRATMAAAETRS